MSSPSTRRSGRQIQKTTGVSRSTTAKSKLFDPVHTARRMYALDAGRVRLLLDGHVIFDHLVRGDFFGEKFLLGPTRRPQTAVALSPVKLTCFRKAELLDRLQQDRRFALRLLRNLALRLDRYERAIRDFVVEPAEVRLARLLLRLAPLRHARDWIRLPFAISNLEFAQMIGTTRWRVSHFLHHFQHLGYLRLQHGIWIKREDLTRFLESAQRSSRSRAPRTSKA